jgi:flap endonuclease-1
MGVKFRDLISPEQLKFEDLDGKTVAIDAANVIYQFLSSIRQPDGTPLKDRNGKITSHFSGILYRTSALIERGIKPIYVFDGQSNILKSETQSMRREIKVKSERKWKEALEEGRIEEARKYAVRSSRMSPEIVEGSKKLLKLMGIPYIQAKGEGEAQASYIVARGDAWSVASQDYDCLLFGAPRMVKNLTISGTSANLELIELKKVLEKLEISRDQLVDLALLVGTDFNLGIKGIGAKKGLKLIKKYGDVYQAMKSLDVQMDVDPEILREMFLGYDFESNYQLKWQKADKSSIIDFLCKEHDFSEERVLSALDKLKKLQTTQSSLEQWF